ncbi:PREDICTED: uncharacterized protein LOC109584867 [Amphimedon queenslandica]|uniref:DOMON domain-containing protein n=2 Tax=Amphimedon queenslandica TaxID=400682 RepID=A0AAN0JI47_AMPQE|nr:PREDICTED: uncharacterized protein LOC109584867 [Amphimedon queenslandica]|eukprot:XP_019856323.1 PREDICTED: uncharacterized protein LOC109584867 [Amphimedon queenslandica]
MKIAILKFAILNSLFAFSLSQCTGRLRDETEEISVSWTVISNNSVNFTFVAPANTSEYAAVTFSNNNVGFTIDTTDMLANIDIIIAGNNGMVYFVEDRWISNVSVSGGPQFDANQDLTNVGTSFNDRFLTVNFTRPIISPNATEDINLDACRYIGFATEGEVESFVSPAEFGGPRTIGLFGSQICLQMCQFEASTEPPTSTTNGAIGLMMPLVAFIIAAVLTALQ